MAFTTKLDYNVQCRVSVVLGPEGGGVADRHQRVMGNGPGLSGHQQI